MRRATIVALAASAALTLVGLPAAAANAPATRATGAPAKAAGSLPLSTLAGDDSEGNAVPDADASFAYPGQVAVDPQGNVDVADSFADKVRLVATTSGTDDGIAVKAGEVFDIAGHGSGDLGLTGIPAVLSNLNFSDGVAIDPSANAVIGDELNDRILVVAASTGTFYGQAMVEGDDYQIAGTGAYGYDGDGLPGVESELASPGFVSVDPSGNIVIADTGNQRIRVLAARSGTFYGRAMTAGDLYTVAGDGTAGFSGDGGPATSAELDGPNSAYTDASGDLVITDNGNDRVRVVAGTTGVHFGLSMTAGDIYTVAGTGVDGYGRSGHPATSAELAFNYYSSTSVDPSGNLVIADTGNGAVRVVPATTGTYYGQAMTAGDIYTVAGDGVLGESGDGGPATKAELGYTNSVAFDPAGNLIVDDGLDVRIVATSTGTFDGRSLKAGDIYALAGTNTDGYSGDGGPATSAELDGPYGVANAAGGGVAVTDTDNHVVRMVAGTTGTYYGQAMTAGDIYTVAGDGEDGDSGDGGPATAAQLGTPVGLALDGSDNLIVTDSTDDQVEVVAQATGTYYGRAMTAGDLYTIAGTGTFGYSGIGGPGTAADIGCVEGVAVDASGNVLIADPCNERILALAAATGTYYGQAMTAGDLYAIAGTGEAGDAPDGTVAASAELDDPAFLAVDGAGDVVYSESNSNLVRLIAGANGTSFGVKVKADHVYTVAGTGAPGYSANGTKAVSAELDHPDGVAVDNAGDLVLADAHNDVVRVLAASGGTAYGVAVKADRLYTIAGDGTYGWSGSTSATATKAELANPVGVAVDPVPRAGGQSVYLADAGNSLVRQLTPAGSG